MKKDVWQKRIPTTAGLFLLLIGIAVTSYLIQSGVIYIGRAGPDKTPKNITVSNITDKSFTVSFTTNDPSDAAISVSSNDMEPTVFFDTRSKNGAGSSFSSHYIIVPKLKPLTQYDFSIISDGTTYLLDGQKYKARTGPKLINTPKNKNKISGKVIMPDGTKASDVIVVADVSGGQTLSTLSNGDGGYSIPLKLLRTTNTNGYFSPKTSTPTEVKFMIKDLLTVIKTTVGAARNIPIVTLSYQYNFAGGQTQTATASSVLNLPAQQVAPGTISITIPQSSQSFIDSRPQFRGTGVAGKSVSITINPGNLKANTQVGLNGTWSYRPDQSLAPSRYTIKIESADSVGVTKTVSQSFSIFASGSQIADSGPTVTPTPVIRAAATATPTVRPTATTVPTIAPSPTPTVGALTPTSTPAPSSTPTPTTAPITPSPTLIAIAPTTAVATPTIAPTVFQQQPKPTAYTTPAPTGNFSTIAFGFASILLIIGGAALLFIL